VRRVLPRAGPGQTMVYVCLRSVFCISECSFVWIWFCSSEAWRGAAHEKQMPFMAGKATVRPRCQGRWGVAFIGAERRSLT